jgi:hypothetical protein
MFLADVSIQRSYFAPTELKNHFWNRVSINIPSLRDWLCDYLSTTFSAYCLLPTPFCLLLSAYCLLLFSDGTPSNPSMPLVSWA